MAHSEGHSVVHVPPTKVFRQLAVNKTILKPRLTAAMGGFSQHNKILCCSAYTISKKAIRFRHPDYNQDRTQKLISSSMSQHMSTRNISSKSMHSFLSTEKHGQKHLPPLSEVTISTVLTEQ